MRAFAQCRRQDAPLKVFLYISGRYAPAGFLFDKIGRVRVVVRDRDGPNHLKPESGESKIEHVFETAMGAGSQDFDIFEKSGIVQVRCVCELIIFVR